MVRMAKIRVINPHQKRARRSGARATNPGLLTMGLMNPQQRKGSMPKAKRKGPKFGSPAWRAKYGLGGATKKKPNPSSRSRTHKHKTGATTKRRPKKNPQGGYMTRRRRSRNPGFVTGGVKMLKQGLYALIGLIVARQLPQLALGARNEGFIGYAANFATALVTGWVGSHFLGADAGSAIVMGGGLFTVARALGDYFSPIQQYLSLSGMGDPLCFGDIQPGYFPLPVPVDSAGNPIIPRQIAAATTTPAMAAAASGGAPIPASVAKAGTMSGVGSPAGRFGGRW